MIALIRFNPGAIPGQGFRRYWHNKTRGYNMEAKLESLNVIRSLLILDWYYSEMTAGVRKEKIHNMDSQINAFKNGLLTYEETIKYLVIDLD